MNFITYFFSDKIVLKMYRAQEVNEADAPVLYRIVSGLPEGRHAYAEGLYHS